MHLRNLESLSGLNKLSQTEAESLESLLTIDEISHSLKLVFYCATIAYHVGLNADLGWPQGIRPMSKKSRHL